MTITGLRTRQNETSSHLHCFTETDLSEWKRRWCHVAMQEMKVTVSEKSRELQ